MRRQVVLALGGLLALGLVGCAEDNGPPPPKPPTQAEQQAVIDKIQNDPNMPQAAKDQAIAGYKAGMARMGTSGPTPGTEPPKASK